MILSCPCCGQSVDSERVDARTLLRSVVLSPSERVVTEMLAERFGRWVSFDRIISRLYGHRADGGPAWAKGTARRFTWTANKRLLPLGLRIESTRGGVDTQRRLVRIPSVARAA